MQSQRAYNFGSFTIPEGATTGTRIEFDAQNGAILVYDATNRLIASVAPMPGTTADGQAYVRGIASYGVPPTNIILSLDGAGALKLEDGPQDTPFVADGLVAATNPGMAGVGNPATLNLYAPATKTAPSSIAFQTLASESANGGTKAFMIRAFTYPNTDGRHRTQGFDYAAKWTGPGSLVDEVWTTLPLDPLFAASSGSTTPQYRLDPHGFVSLRGIANKTTAGAPPDGTLVATLPAGYRPKQTEIIPIACDVVATIARIEVNTSGAITVYGMTNRLPSFGGVRFAVAALS